jgi:hypothetical protein
MKRRFVPRGLVVLFPQYPFLNVSSDVFANPIEIAAGADDVIVEVALPDEFAAYFSTTDTRYGSLVASNNRR